MSFDFYIYANTHTSDTKEWETHARVKILAKKRGDSQARGIYEKLFQEQNGQESKYNQVISPASSLLKSMCVDTTNPSDLSILPLYSFFLQFQFTLARPFISRDDEPFHIIDNPVRKDRVFKVPVVPATSWKGNLRWAAMKADLEPVKDDPQEFARRRFRQTLLFGTEKGFDTSSNWELFLDHRCNLDRGHSGKCQDAKCQQVGTEYRRLLRNRFGPDDQGLPHLEGWLHFYPTFFDKIGLEVINPHNRRTRAGKQPIFFECAPEGASGTFSLLYLPWGQVSVNEAKQDLATITRAISGMMLNYGFSAKKTSGYGEAQERINKGFIRTRADQRSLASLPGLEQEVSHVNWT